MKTTSRLLFVALAASMALGVTACGGGGSAPVANVPGTDVPETATSNSVAALGFVRDVVGTGDRNSDEPIELGSATLATSETEEPDPSI